MKLRVQTKQTFGLRIYFFQLQRALDRALHLPWEGLVAYYSNRKQPREVAVCLEAAGRSVLWGLPSFSTLRAAEVMTLKELLSELAQALADPRTPGPSTLSDLRRRVDLALEVLPWRSFPALAQRDNTGTPEHFGDNSWQIPLPPGSYLGFVWPSVPENVRATVLSHDWLLHGSFARGYWLELYGIRRSLDCIRSRVGAGWLELAAAYPDDLRWQRLVQRLADEASAFLVEGAEQRVHADLMVLKQPILAFSDLIQQANPPTLDKLAEVHSLFEPAMNLLESQGRKTALEWRARVRSLDDPAGREVGTLLGIPWP